MNEKFEISPEFQSLLSELMDGTLSAARRLELRELLRDNPAAQDAYRNFIAVHALLHLDFGGGELPLLPPVVRSLPSLVPMCSSISATEFNQGASQAAVPQSQRTARGMRTLGAFSAVAAAVLLIALGITKLASPTGATRNSTSAQIAGDPSLAGADARKSSDEYSQTEMDAVAILGQASNAVWSDSKLPLDIGSMLPAGKFELQKGLVQVDFFSGANVIIQAPANFQLVSPNRIECDLGRIRAHVPSQAKGFTVKTPKYTAVDLGTEFTVQVMQTGESLFQVLLGEVQLWNGRPDGSRPAQLLTAGQGVRATPSGELVTIEALSSNFVGREQMIELTEAAHRERYESWKQFSQRLRTDPNIVVYYGCDGHSAWDRVLRNDGPANSNLLNGAIVGCQWTNGRWLGKQALEFKRTSDRVRLIIPGEFESITLAAWLRIEGLERWLSSLLLTDGHEPGEVHWQMTDMGQLMLGVKAEPERSHDFYSPSVIGPLDLGRWVHLACVYDGKRGYVSHYLDGAEVSRETIRIRTTLRIGPAEIGNWVPQELKDYRRRSLNGRVDEFILLKSALSHDQIQAIYEAGRPRS